MPTKTKHYKRAYFSENIPH